jgi:hypothetical protein
LSATQSIVSRIAAWSNGLLQHVPGKGMDQAFHSAGRDSRRSLGAFAL